MTVQEFSNEFDILYGNITNGQAPALDEYEKSVFLTKAQSEIIKEYFNARVDSTDSGFDGSQKRQYDFSQLITTEQLTKVDAKDLPTQFHPNSTSFYFPSDYFLSINEIIESNEGNSRKIFSIIPITYVDYQKVIQKPYPYPPKNCVWRIFYATATNATSEEVPIAGIIGKCGDNFSYNLRYVKKPSPIVLVSLASDNLSIEGTSEQTNCQLPSQIHQDILERAVTLAKIAYQAGSTSSIVQQQQQQQNYNNRR